MSSPNLEPTATEVPTVPERTGTLGRAFDSTAASYKFFWFLALLRLLPHATDATLGVRRIVAEMIVLAWAPAALYRLSFGAHDRLQNTVRDLQTAKRLRSTATETQVRAAIGHWIEAEGRLEALSNIVPTRFLGPWLELGLSPTIRDDRRTRAILRTALETLNNRDGPPYAIERTTTGAVLRFGPGWRDWLLEHQRVLESHAELALTRFLQARNPHVPGITEKVRMPGTRKLVPARRLFEHVRLLSGVLEDPYDGCALGKDYAIDHVLPRSFVAHDLTWNLVATRNAHNSTKGEVLPASSLLGGVARFHHTAISAAPAYSGALDDYTAAFGIDEDELRALPADGFVERYLQLLMPLMQIALAQGFRGGWIPRVPEDA